MIKVTPTAPLLVAQDLSAIGSLSLQVALPILAAFNIATAALPTSLLSTQTEGFNSPVAANLTTWFPAAFTHWQQQKITFSGSLLGYLGTDNIVTLIQQLLTTRPAMPVIFDPVMADQGMRYPNLAADYPQQLTQLLPLATVITPNLTEAQLLTEIPFNPAPTRKEQVRLLKALAQKLPASGYAMITGITIQQEVGCIWLVHDQLHFYGHRRLAGHFYGSGDVLTALLTGFLQCGESLATAIKYAVDGTFLALKQTEYSQRERHYGIVLSDLLIAIGHYLHTGNFITK